MINTAIRLFTFTLANAAAAQVTFSGFPAWGLALNHRSTAGAVNATRNALQYPRFCEGDRLPNGARSSLSRSGLVL